MTVVRRRRRPLSFLPFPRSYYTTCVPAAAAATKANMRAFLSSFPRSPIFPTAEQRDARSLAHSQGRV